MKALVKKWLALLLVAGMLLGGGGGLTAYAQQPAGADSQVQIEAAAGDDGETPAGSSLPENTAMEDTPAGESAADASVPADGTVAPDPGGVPDDSVADSLPDSSNALPEDGGAADGSLPDDSVADISDADNSSGTDTSELDGDAVETEEDSAVSEADADAAPADLNALLALAATDGAEVARLLNLYDDDDAYLAALKELLVFYYSLEEASDQQAPFLAGLDVRAEALAADFAAAAEERATDPYTLGYMPGEVLVQFRTYLSEARAEQTTETLDGSLEVVLLETGNRLTTVVDIPLWQTVAQAIEAFTADPNVVFAEPDYVLRLEDESNAEDVAADYAALLAPEENMAEEALSPEAAAAPNDPDSQWHHARINTTDAWALLPDQGAGNAVTVAVIDTMPDTAHEDLAGVFLTDHIQSFDRNGVTTTREAEPSPPASNRDHATMVSGIIAANANNSLGGYGIASGNDSAYNQTVKLMALDAQGDTSYSVSSMIQAINYAVTYEAQVINMSLGGVFAESSALTTAVKNAVTADIVVVNSAGNLNMDDTKYATDAYDSYYSSLSPAQNPPARTALHYPSDYDGVLGVIWLHSSAYAVGINPRYVGSTTYSGSNYGWRKEISAPGSLIYSTTSQNATKYREGSGSSYAAPMVAAVAALVRYANPALTAQQVMDILCATATDLHIPGRDRETGYGCVNAEAAVRMALATLPPENLATAGGHGQVALSWDAVPGADGYQVYAQAPGGSMALLETLPAGTTTCTHQNLAVAGSYQYQVAPLVNLTRQNVINKKLLYTDAATDQANIATEAVRIEGVAATAAMTVTVPATGVAVTPAASTLRLTQSLQLTATVSPAAASDKTVSWASTNTAVATVDSSGLLTAVSPGNAAIRATTTDGGFIADCTVTVVTPATGVALDKGSHTLVYPGTFQLTATVSPATATDKTVSWSSLSPAVATVSSSGVVTAVGPGNAVIRATTTDGDHTADCTVTVTMPASGVTLDKSSHTLVLADTLQLTATVSPANATDKTVHWSSLNPAVATVDGAGLVTAVGGGATTITATTTSGGFKASCAITVHVPATGVSLSKNSAALAPGQSTALSATVLPADATTKMVRWSSSNPAVASVSSTGVVTALADGTATITATSTENGSLTADCVVTVASIRATGVALDKASATVGRSRTVQLTATVSPADTTNKTLRWASGNTAVARVSGTGLVTGAAVGSTTITVETVDGGFVASCTVTVTDVSVSGVALDAPSATLAPGGTRQLVATLSPADASNKTVGFASSNPAVASVSGAGLVTALAPGSATITATTADGGYTAACVVTVTKPVTGVALDVTSQTLKPGVGLLLNAAVSPADAANSAVSFASSNPAVASVNGAGLVTALAPGSATITVTTDDGGFTATCVVTVTTPVTGVALNAATLMLEPGETSTLAATVAPANATNPAVAWQSSNPAVATVESGVVTAVAVGSASITVTAADGGFTASCAVAVVPPVTAVKLPQATLNLVKGKNVTISAAAITADGSKASLAWASSNEAIATVSPTGKVRAMGTGKAVITATAQNGQSASLKVTVVKKASTKVTAVSASVPKSMTAGTRKAIAGKYTPSSATGVKVSFKSSKSSVLAVSSAGVLTAKKAGTATITVKAGTASRKYTVTVKAPAAKALRLSKDTATVKKGRTISLKMSVTPSYADKAVTWKSSNTKVATVSSTGVVKGVKKGTATITVTAKKGKKKATCVVTVK